MTQLVEAYRIQRPPLAAKFELPSRDRLLEVNPGDQVKLGFAVGERQGERMWVEVIECCHPRSWRGILKNEPHHMENLRVGDDITFHPLDVIDVLTYSAITATTDDDQSNIVTMHEFCNTMNGEEKR